MSHITRYIPLCMMLGAVVSACSETETDAPSLYDSPDTYITFAHPGINLDATVGDFAVTSRSRSTLATTVDRFKVWGFCVPNNISGGKNESSAPFDWNRKSRFFTSGADLTNLNGEEVLLTPNSTTYNGGDLTEWHKNTSALHSFIAATGNATFSLSGGEANTDDKDNPPHGPRLLITLPITGSSIDTELDHNAMPDVMVAAKFDHKGSDGRVPLSFFHIMTGIRFKFNNYTDDELYIDKVTYSGEFHREAIIDFTTTSPVMRVTDNKYTGTFTLLSERQTIPASGSFFMGGDSSDGTTFLFLPNPEGTVDNTDGKYVIGRNKEIKIYYSLKGDTMEREPFVLGENFTLNYLPKPNTKHTAHFNFVGDGFIVIFQADDTLNWEDGNLGGSSDITIM